MAHITLAPGPLELGLHREQYDALVRDLEQQGHDVWLEPPKEFRSLPEAVGGEAWMLTVHVAGMVSDHLIDGLIGLMLGRLLGRRLPDQAPRWAVIYGPDGRELRRVELPSEEED